SPCAARRLPRAPHPAPPRLRVPGVGANRTGRDLLEGPAAWVAARVGGAEQRRRQGRARSAFRPSDSPRLFERSDEGAKRVSSAGPASEQRRAVATVREQPPRSRAAARAAGPSSPL